MDTLCFAGKLAPLFRFKVSMQRKKLFWIITTIMVLTGGSFYYAAYSDVRRHWILRNPLSPKHSSKSQTVVDNAPSKGTQIYSNYGFSIAYPSDWYVREYTGLDEMSSVLIGFCKQIGRFSCTPSPGGFANISFRIRHNAKRLDLIDYLRSEGYDFDQTGQSVAGNSFQRIITIDGHEAVSLGPEVTSEGGRYEDTVFVASGDQVYQIDVFDSEKEFIEMIETMKFTN